MEWSRFMRVPIVDNIVLTSDPHNFVLNREEVGKNGKKRLRPFAFCPTVYGAIEDCLKIKMRGKYRFVPESAPDRTHQARAASQRVVRV